MNAVRAAILVEKGSVAEGLALAEPAAETLAADESRYGRYFQGMLSITMGLAYKDQGKTEAAVQAYATASQQRDQVMVALVAAYEQGKLLQEMGRLSQAEPVHRAAMAWVARRHSW